ncbi:hypothetical protein GHT09_006706 [Marmota monax]|uniref:Uncharacterized protein n=1 Tax=Marmota monax TaxID=9995 RepID=A0A834V3B8_MARMO|nr:hypothetical protein GHT09_006706 [Marmota monax]
MSALPFLLRPILGSSQRFLTLPNPPGRVHTRTEKAVSGCSEVPEASPGCDETRGAGGEGEAKTCFSKVFFSRMEGDRCRAPGLWVPRATVGGAAEDIEQSWDSRGPAQAPTLLARPEPVDPTPPVSPSARPLCETDPVMPLSLLVLLLLQPSHAPGALDLWRCFQHLEPSVHREGDLLLGAFFPLYYVNRKAPLARLYFLLRPHGGSQQTARALGGAVESASKTFNLSTFQPAASCPRMVVRQNAISFAGVSLPLAVPPVISAGGLALEGGESAAADLWGGVPALRFLIWMKTFVCPFSLF